MKKLTKTLYIDAMALVQEKKSGIGVTLEQTLEQLAKNPDFKDWTIYLVATLGKAKYLKKYESSNVHIKTIFIYARVLEVLSRTRLLLPIDWFLGKGVYLFPNYRNWPTWRSRSITYVYDVAYIKHPETVSAKNQRYLSRYMPSWLRRTDRVVTISEQVKYEIEKYIGFDESRTNIVPCGVDRSVFYKRNTQAIEAVKQRYAIEYDKYFLFVGNIEPRKNLETMLEAYDQLPAEIQNEYGLVFVGGSGWHNEGFYEKLEKMQQAGRKVMKISDYVPSSDLPALYSGATMLVHTAIYEGFGIPPLEAMACETPVAVSDLPAIREVVGEAGVYFDPRNVPSITSAIQTILTDADLVKINVARGLEIATIFSWKHSAHELSKAVKLEYELGARRHPILSRLRSVYHTLDRTLLRVLGEKDYPPYAPQVAETAEELRQNILNDFVKEQPSRFQLILKKIYLTTKHGASRVVRKGFRLVKTSSSKA